MATFLRANETEMGEELKQQWEEKWDFLTQQYESENPGEIPPLLQFSNDNRQEPVWPPKWRR